MPRELAGASAPSSGAAAQRLVVVEGRVLWSDSPRFGFEVIEVLGAPVGASVIVVQDARGRGPLGRLLERSGGTELRLELFRERSGEYVLRSAHWLRPNDEELIEPPPLALQHEPTAQQRTASRLRVAALATASFEQQVMELVNQERWNNGMLPPLKRVDLLDNAAETHATNMANRDFHMHCDPDTMTSPGSRMQAAGYLWYSAGENIAAGYQSPASVMAGWMSSPGHRAAILSTSWYEIGIGFYLAMSDAGNVRSTSVGGCTPNYTGGPYYYYWTQDFGIRNHFPVVIDREAVETTDLAVDLYLYGTGFAQEMRLRNENAPWTAWMPFQANVGWTLSSGNGTKTVSVEIRNGGVTYAASDTIELNAPCPTSTTIQSQTLVGSHFYQDCSINAGPALDVASGSTTLEANVVRIRTGFSVAQGATLHVQTPYVP